MTKIQEQMNVPNTASLIRILIGVTVPLWWYHDSWLPVVCISIAGLSDWFDGWYARKFSAETPLGIQLDPIADKLFCWFVLSYVVYINSAEILGMFVALMIGYDIFNTCIRIDMIRDAIHNQYYTGPKKRGVTWLSKWKTAWLFVLMVVFVPQNVEDVALVQITVLAAAFVLVFACLVFSFGNTSSLKDRNRWRSMMNSKR